MAKVQILYWHGIPLQVRARDRAGRVSQPMASRFQNAVDKIAVAAGVVGDDQYLAGLQWGDSQVRTGTAAEVVAEVVAELEVQFKSIDWRAVAETLIAQER